MSDTIRLVSIIIGSLIVVAAAILNSMYNLGPGAFLFLLIFAGILVIGGLSGDSSKPSG